MTALFSDPDFAGGLSCTLTGPSPGVTVVTVVGEIDTATVPDVARTLDEAAAISGRVVLDLSRAAFLSCDALRVLHRAHERIELVIVASGRVIPRTLAVTGMDGLLSVYPDLVTAIEHPRHTPSAS
ncbi:STAS domain-containing protein [Amycolatopsis sp. cg5]|uniref:STAS domain-containing protein n=1 Tax=Amycolatopsis sp. cg5 TaxID=3238802 RepID=UPI0035244696